MTPELELLRPALLRLHGLLLQAERRERERLVGPISNQVWFGAALADPELAWLRAASRLVSAIDEGEAQARRTGESPSAETIRGWLAEARAFTTPGPRYLAFLQSDPEVVLAHRDVVCALPPREEIPVAESGPLIVDNAGEHRFEARLPEGVAFVAYRLQDGAIVFTHTEVPEELEGRGLGNALVRRALDSARERGLHVVPLCPFVAAYIRRHDEYADLIRG
jgi:predicted GNAT family acetyltransferase